VIRVSPTAIAPKRRARWLIPLGSEELTLCHDRVSIGQDREGRLVTRPEQTEVRVAEAADSRELDAERGLNDRRIREVWK
jgi:hypothetical protein